LLVPLANVLTTATGSWHAVFYVAAILNIIAAAMALLAQANAHPDDGAELIRSRRNLPRVTGR